MRKRAIALILALCMIVPVFGGVAEELAEPSLASPIALQEELLPAEEAGADVLAEEELPPEEEADADAPTDEELPPAEEADADAPEDADLPPAEDAGMDVPEDEELPPEEIAAEAVAAEEPTIEVGYAGADTDIDTIAYGSAELPYAGVAYISRASYESLPADAQAAYDRMVDDVNGMLDAGVALENVVFSVRADGTVASTFSMPMLRFGEEALVEESLIEAPAEEGALPSEDAPAAEEPAIEAPAEAYAAEAFDADSAAGEEPQGIIESNVALAEQVYEPIRTIPGGDQGGKTERIALDLDSSFGLTPFGKQFDQTEDWFYSQLSDGGKLYFDAAYDAMVKGQRNGFKLADIPEYDVSDALDALSALIDTYPTDMEWMSKDTSKSTLYIVPSYNAGTKLYTIEVTLTISQHYSGSLNAQARSEVRKAVKDAQDYAKRYTPDNPYFGMVQYFDYWICARCYYNKEISISTDQSSADYYYCHTSYGALLKGFGVCESYALAMARLLDAAGIPNLYVTSTTTAGGHAWNYAQMPDGKYYLLDSTWNDTLKDSTGMGNTAGRYLLCADDLGHKPEGRIFKNENAHSFNYPSRSDAAYDSRAKTFTLNKRALFLAKGKTSTLSLGSGKWFADGAKKTWTSSDKSVATVSSKGKVTAKKTGTATITMSANGQSAECTVYVYQTGGIKFRDNNKTSRTVTIDLDEGAQEFVLDVDMKTSASTASELLNLGAVAEPTAKSSKPSVASAIAAVNGNTVTVTVQPLKAGKSTITIKFAGKSAKLTVKVCHMIRDDWFALEYDSTPYTGKARKPKVLLTDAAPKGVTYKVSYSNNTNKNAEGETAIAKITGTGYYGSTVEKHFTVTAGEFSKEPGVLTEVSIKHSPVSVTYNGKEQRPSVTVTRIKDKKKLKEGRDYEILYNYLDAAKNEHTNRDLPKYAFTYTLCLKGIGNYDTGTVLKLPKRQYTIEPYPLSKLKLSLKTPVAYTGSPVSSAADSLNLQVKIGKTALPEGVDYTVLYTTDAAGLNEIPAPTERGIYYAWIKVRSINISHPEDVNKRSIKFQIK